jgi:hypothetical protein
VYLLVNETLMIKLFSVELVIDYKDCNV